MNYVTQWGSKPWPALCATVLGVDPQMMATRASEERQADAKHRIDEEWERLFGPDDGDDENGLPIMGRSDRRAAGLKPTSR